MKVAVISDIHDNIWALDRALTDIRRREADALVVCGDLCAPFSLKAIAEGFPGPVHAVFGNNDGDQMLLTRLADGTENVTLHGVFGEFQVDGTPLAVTHYPELGRRLAACGGFRAVFYGHSHRPEVARNGDCLAMNPGELMGRFGTSSYGLYDTDTGTAEIIEL